MPLLGMKPFGLFASSFVELLALLVPFALVAVVAARVICCWVRGFEGPDPDVLGVPGVPPG